MPVVSYSVVRVVRLLACLKVRAFHLCGALPPQPGILGVADAAATVTIVADKHSSPISNRRFFCSSIFPSDFSNGTNQRCRYAEGPMKGVATTVVPNLRSGLTQLAKKYTHLDFKSFVPKNAGEVEQRGVSTQTQPRIVITRMLDIHALWKDIRYTSERHVRYTVGAQ